MDHARQVTNNNNNNKNSK